MSNSTAMDPLASVLRRYRKDASPVTPKRKLGRPVKRTPAYFSSVLECHKEVEAWFDARHGHKAASVTALYTAYFAEQFASRGERPGRASSAAFQSKLKTLRNELAEARRLFGNP